MGEFVVVVIVRFMIADYTSLSTLFLDEKICLIAIYLATLTTRKSLNQPKG